MKNRSTSVAFALVFGLALPVLAADKAQPVRMGCGLMTFDTVPGWGLGPDGKSVIGPCHGSVVVDKDGNIYTSAHAGVFVFSPDGKVVRSFLGDKYSDIHDMKIREEADGEFIYGARNANAEGIKFNAQTGEIVLKLPFPEESGLKLKKFNPTAITVAPNGDIFLSDGYASDHIFKFDKTGKYLMHFGTKGNGLKEFNTAHGMTLDTRYSPPRLLICDRNHQPKGRLLHYDLDGEFIDEVVTGLGMPTSAVGPGRLRLRAGPARAAGHPRQEQHDHRGPRLQPRPREGGELQRPAGAVDRGDLQRHARLVLGQGRQPVRPGLERRGPHHEAGARQVALAHRRHTQIRGRH